jgi:flagellar biosynthesis/type III secretory pathway protein FliH
VIPRARIVRAAVAGGSRPAPLVQLEAGAATRKRLAREVVEAHLEAERIVATAKARAEEIVAEAREQAATEGAQARRELTEEADATLAARWLQLRQEEQRALGSAVDRVLALGTALAERILDATLALEPGRVVDIAKRVVAEAGGARRAVIEAHPVDAETLRAHLAEARLGIEVAEVRETEALARGELRLHTDIGIVDARLTPRLDRLAAAIRDLVGQR